MKKLILVGIASAAFMLFFGCAQNQGNEAGGPTNAAKETQPVEKKFTNVTITDDKMEFESKGGTLAIDGTAIESDDLNSSHSIGERFGRLLHSNSVLSTNHSSQILIKFKDVPPERIKWFDYYMNADGAFIYAGPKDMAAKEGAQAHSIGEVGELTILEAGMSRDRALSSSQQKTYRGIRIICEYEDRLVEHLMLFDSALLVAPTP